MYIHVCGIKTRLLEEKRSKVENTILENNIQILRYKFYFSVKCYIITCNIFRMNLYAFQNKGEYFVLGLTPFFRCSPCKVWSEGVPVLWDITLIKSPELFSIGLVHKHAYT